MVCAHKGCGEPIIGAYRGLGDWVGGVHQSDFLAGRYVEATWPQGGGLVAAPDVPVSDARLTRVMAPTDRPRAEALGFPPTSTPQLVAARRSSLARRWSEPRTRGNRVSTPPAAATS